MGELRGASGLQDNQQWLPMLVLRLVLTPLRAGDTAPNYLIGGWRLKMGCFSSA